MALTSDQSVDVAIIGAGPAGCVAAIELARHGQRVLLIERRRFPRAKVCGGCLSGRAVKLLRDLLAPNETLPGVQTRQIAFVFGSYRLKCDPHGATRLVLRAELDDWLARLAGAAGAELQFGARADLIRNGPQWQVSVGDDRVRATWILVAAGLSNLGTQLGIVGRPPRRRLVAQQWLQPRTSGLPALGCAEMHWLHGGYVGLATPAADRTVVALAADVPPHHGEDVWSHLRRMNPRAEVYSSLPEDAPRRYAAKGSAGFPWRPTRLGTENVLLIGDAAGYEEPFSGEGMEQAMYSASFATRAILNGGHVLREYTGLMRRHHRLRIWRLRGIGRFLNNPLIHRLAHAPAFVPDRPLARLVQWVHVGVPA